MNRIIGSREFTDGTQRAVHEDENGRQFVMDDEGNEVIGVWLMPDEPSIVDENATSKDATSVVTHGWSQVTT